MVQPILLIVEDEESTREGLKEALEDRFDIYVAAGIAEAKSILDSTAIDVMLTDLRLGAEDGLQLVREYSHTSLVTVVMTAYGSVETAFAAVKAGAFHFVTKPLDLDDVELILLKALQHLKSKNQPPVTPSEVTTLQTIPPSVHSNELDRIVGHSQPVLTLKKIISQVAPTKATVLIEGESGTGKELIAHAIHSLSGRKKIVIVNCAALPSQLLESELFGHEKGAFTDAKTQRVGRFEEASGGTLFLDEIGEIDSSIQIKLLRVLSEKTIQRIGSNKSIQVDTRVVAATNKSLARLVEAEEFREDLYFRLNVVKITPPPLRERASDIPLLIQVLLERVVEENKLEEKRLSPNALAQIQAQEWPGNIRQLSAVLESAAIMSTTSEITVDDLPEELFQRKLNLEAKSVVSPSLRTQFDLKKIERETIIAALEYTSQNKSKAAELLGISRRTLQRKLNEQLLD